MQVKRFKVGEEVYFISFVYLDLKDPQPKKCYVCKGKVLETNETYCRINDTEHKLKEYVLNTHIYTDIDSANKRAYMINKEE